MDVITENALLFLSWGEGDLNFQEDGKALKFFLLALNLASLFSFLGELCIMMTQKKSNTSNRTLFMLKLIHLGVEDLWQMNMFTIVGLSRALDQGDSPAAGVWIASLLQSLCFLGVRIYELMTSD